MSISQSKYFFFLLATFAKIGAGVSFAVLLLTIKYAYGECGGETSRLVLESQLTTLRENAPAFGRGCVQRDGSDLAGPATHQRIQQAQQYLL